MSVIPDTENNHFYSLRLSAFFIKSTVLLVLIVGQIVPLFSTEFLADAHIVLPIFGELFICAVDSQNTS